MAREVNAMITFDDATYMVANEGFLAFETIPSSLETMTSDEIKYYFNADVMKFSNYADNQLVPYHLLEPFGDLKACGSSFTKGTSTKNYHQVNIDFGTATGTCVFRFNAFDVPNRFSVTWNGNYYTTGWVGSDTAYQDDLVAAGYSESEINLGNGNASIVFEKTLANPTSAQVVVEEFGNSTWSANSSCIT